MNFLILNISSNKSKLVSTKFETLSSLLRMRFGVIVKHICTPYLNHTNQLR